MIPAHCLRDSQHTSTSWRPSWGLLPVLNVPFSVPLPVSGSDGALAFCIGACHRPAFAEHCCWYFERSFAYRLLRKVSCSWPLTNRVAAFQLLNLTEWWSRLPRVETNACFSLFCLSNMSVISFWLFFWGKFEHQQAGRLGRKYLCTLFHQRCNTFRNTWQLFMYPFVHDRLWIPSRQKCYSVHSTSQWCLKCKQRTQTQLEGTPGNGDRYTICTRNTSTVLQLWFTPFHGPPVCKEIAWVSDYRKIITGTPSITLFEVSLQYCFHHKTTFRPPAKRWVLFALSYAPFHA